MSTRGQLALIPSMAAVALVLTVPDTVVGQTLSARPASVSLTVVVPPRPEPGVALATERSATIVGGTATMLDLRTLVGLADRPASRIEVRLGTGWPADLARVLIRNRSGEYERLGSDARVIAFDAPPSLARIQSPVDFRVASDKPLAAALTIPVEYRITIGTSDQIAVWSFPSLIRLGHRSGSTSEPVEP